MNEEPFDLTSGEKARVKELLWRIEASGNDGADIYDYEDFINHLKEKYGNDERVEQILKSL